MVLVDDAEVLFTGDLCFFGVTPLAFGGDPAAWAAVLATLPDLAEQFVPGHGPVGGPETSRRWPAICPPVSPPAAIRPPSRPGRGTNGLNGRNVTPSTSNGPPCWPPGRTRRACHRRCCGPSACRGPDAKQAVPAGGTGRPVSQRCAGRGVSASRTERGRTSKRAKQMLNLSIGHAPRLVDGHSQVDVNSTDAVVRPGQKPLVPRH